MTTLRGKRGEREWRRGRSVLSKQRQQSGWETGPSITLPVFQRQPRHALLSPYEANWVRLKLGVRSPLSLFPHALQFIASPHPPASTSHPTATAYFACIDLSWYMHYCWAFRWKPVTLHVSSAWLSTGRKKKKKDSWVNSSCADGGRWKWDGLSDFLITPAEK